MLLRITRILMTAADGSPGGGAPPAPGAPAAGTPAAVPTTPPAQGATPILDRATEDALVRKGRDAAFAELRRSGALKKSFLQNTGEGDGNGAAATPATSAQLDVAQGRRLDRALARHGHASRLNDAAYGRIERALAAETPDDIDGWVQEYFGGMGVAQPGAAPPAASMPNQPTAPPAGPPVTARGAPGPSQAPLEQMDILKMSDSDRRALIAQKGLRFYTDRLRAQLRGVRVEVRRP